MLAAAACRPATPPSPTPTRPRPTAAALPDRQPTRTARPVVAPPTDTPTPAPLPTLAATATNTPPPATPINSIGRSVGGRPITVQRYGTGERVLLLVGGVHGGWESNTVELMRELGEHFSQTPEDVLPGLSVVIIPALNPDGVAVGASLEGRFNGNGVDLNRNWACGWQAEAVWREGPVDPGGGPFSEPETRALADFIEQTRPAAALFYHSAANGVFAGNCAARQTEWRSDDLSAVYGEAANYSYGRTFSAYPVTGTAPSWVDGLGIPAADVELSSPRDSQFARNLRGVLAAQCWLLGRDAMDVPACN